VTWNIRLCRECRGRFVPTRLDQHRCSDCDTQSHELQKLLTYLRAHPEEPVTRVSVATGVSEQEIARLASDGLLPVVPAGAEPKRTCTCDGGARCPVCKAAVAQRIVRAVGLPGTPSSRPPDLAQIERARAAGMRSRRTETR
jgi:hypothetical protein